MQTKYYLITNKENSAIKLTIAVNKKIRVRSILLNGKVQETKINYSNDFLNILKKHYEFKEITYNQFLFFQYL
jgi:hypothetical protein